MEKQGYYILIAKPYYFRNFRWTNSFSQRCTMLVIIYLLSIFMRSKFCFAIMYISFDHIDKWVKAHRITMSQINMIPYPFTLNWHWANQSCSRLDWLVQCNGDHKPENQQVPNFHSLTLLDRGSKQRPSTLRASALPWGDTI